MTDQQTMERVQQEVHSANHDRLYQATLKEVQENKKQVPSYTLDELKISHHNYILNRRDMFKEELRKILKNMKRCNHCGG